MKFGYASILCLALLYLSQSSANVIRDLEGNDLSAGSSPELDAVVDIRDSSEQLKNESKKELNEKKKDIGVENDIKLKDENKELEVLIKEELKEKHKEEHKKEPKEEANKKAKNEHKKEPKKLKKQSETQPTKKKLVETKTIKLKPDVETDNNIADHANTDDNHQRRPRHRKIKQLPVVVEKKGHNKPMQKPHHPQNSRSDHQYDSLHSDSYDYNYYEIPQGDYYYDVYDPLDYYYDVLDQAYPNYIIPVDTSYLSNPIYDSLVPRMALSPEYMAPYAVNAMPLTQFGYENPQLAYNMQNEYAKRLRALETGLTTVATSLNSNSGNDPTLQAQPIEATIGFDDTESTIYNDAEDPTDSITDQVDPTLSIDAVDPTVNFY